MKITPITTPNILKCYPTARTIPIKMIVPSGCDEVIFSDEALSFSKAMAEIEFRSKEERMHIADITNAVRRGEYRIDSDKIADKILESVLRQ